MYAALIAVGALLFILAIDTSEGRGRLAGPDKGHLQKAVSAGGCFWCMQPAFDRLKGVISTVVGYTGGTVENPT